MFLISPARSSHPCSCAGRSRGDFEEGNEELCLSVVLYELMFDGVVQLIGGGRNGARILK